MPRNLLLCFGLDLFAVALSKGIYTGLGPLGLRFDAVALANKDSLALFAYAVLAIGPIAATLIVGIWIWRLRVMHRMHQHAVKRSEIGL